MSRNRPFPDTLYFFKKKSVISDEYKLYQLNIFNEALCTSQHVADDFEHNFIYGTIDKYRDSNKGMSLIFRSLNDYQYEWFYNVEVFN